MKRFFSLFIIILAAGSLSAQTLSDTLVLDGSAVVAQKNLVKMDVDKITYKVEDDVDSKTSTVLDMLRKVPMVSVDGQDNITVNGSSSFQIYVDGKPNPMLSSNPSQILKFMPASAVKNIEVVTNPGAKYDAEGVGGVLNINTAMSQSGSSAITEDQYGNVTLQGTTRGFSGSAYYSMQKGKWAFSVNLNASKTNNEGALSEMERIQKMEGGDYITRTSGEADVRTPFYMGNINLSYEIDSLNLISISAGYLGRHPSSESLFDTEIVTPFMESAYGGSIFTATSSHSITANMDYQHIWTGRPEKSLVLSYQFSGTPSYSDITNRIGGAASMADRRTDGFTNSLSHAMQADFSTPLGSQTGQKLNAGVKFISRHNLSDQKNMIFDGSDFEYVPDGSVMYDFFNNIGAVYAEYDGKCGPLGFKAGLRYEHTWQKVEYVQGRDFSLDYGSVVPAASIQYNIGMQQNIGLSYNMRISRPGITYLNPYVDNISDPTQRTYGNPDLEAETGHTLSAVYNWFSPKWIVSLTLRQNFTDNGISPYSFYDDDHILNTTYANIISTSVSGLNAFLTWIPGQKTRVMFNGGCSYNSIWSDELGQSNSGWTYNALLGFQQTLPWDLRFSMNAIASGRTYTLQGWSSGVVAGTFGLMKSILEDRLIFSLSGVTHLTGGHTIKIESMSETNEFISRASTYIPLRMIAFNISFSFGKQDKVNVKKSRKSLEADSQLNTQSMSQSLGTMIQM